MSNTLRRHALVLALAVGCFAARPISPSAQSASSSTALDALFARYDGEPDGPARDQLAAQIDATAHQKYATVSRLYWYTDLASATAAAHQSGKPILQLRMLGNLDEELSCANSRLFRATLYANQEVALFLREKFVLYWSSERPVPRVTIDYGDGRKLERTTSGNSAHYILDERGNVLDVLPGLYAPTAFLRELKASLALAASVRGKTDDERARLLVDYHSRNAQKAKRDWEALAVLPWNTRAGQLQPQARIDNSLAAAQRATVSKAGIELPDIRAFAKGLAPEALPEYEVEKWSAAGQMLYATPRVLDKASRALVVRLHNEVPSQLRANGEQLDAMVARLEKTIVADTALNQLRLRPQIEREIVRRGGRIDFATLNAWIYAEVFHTPKADAWLGLLPRTAFSGLPGDGIVIR